MSNTRKGKSQSIDTCKKISESHSGKKLSLEHIQNISKSRIGKSHKIKFPRSAEYKEKISIARKKTLELKRMLI